MAEDLPVETTPLVEPVTWGAAADPGLDWYCARCLRGVAREYDRVYRDGRSEFEFENPEGRRFHILLFADCPGGRAAGLPTELHTWFPGHAWCYCICRGCGLQLGWWYVGDCHFVGLIRSRIVSARQWCN